MKQTPSKLIIIFTFLTLLMPSLVQASLERVGDFALLDQTGRFHQLSRYQHRKALVVMSYSQRCEQMDSLLQEYRKLQESYSAEGIEFLVLDSMGRARSELQNLTQLPLLEDDGQLVSETLEISQAGEIKVLNPQRLSLYYQGPATNELREALREIAQGNEISDTVTLDLDVATDSCSINYSARDKHQQSPPDYTTEIAPIISRNCGECHRQGGVGPFALDSYIMVLGWSPMIREVLLNKRMPPIQVDPYIGHSIDARYISDDDIQTLVHWIDAGGPRGEGEEDPLEMLQVDKSETETLVWELGEPDYVVTGPRNQIASTGVLDYSYTNIDLPFTEDKWVAGFQYLPGEVSVLHHLMTYVTSQEEDFWGPEREQEFTTRRFLGGFAPGGRGAVEFAEGTAIRIPAGHKLSMQFHYVTNGQSVEDVTQLGLYFADNSDGSLKEVFNQSLSPRFVLPANEAEHSMDSEYTFDREIVLTGVRARMSFRGKHMKFIATSPDGTSRDLFSIPAYNYGWQPHYLLDEAVRLAAGTTVKIKGAFDNSISNPLNPDPEKELSFGVESWEEMFSGYLSFYYAD